MSHLSALRRQIAGPPPARQPNPHDHLTKDQLWQRIQTLESAIKSAHMTAYRYAHEAHNAHDAAERDRFYEVARILTDASD